MALWPLGISSDSVSNEDLTRFTGEIYRTLLSRRTVGVWIDDVTSRLASFLPNIVNSQKYGMQRSEWLDALIGGSERYLEGVFTQDGENFQTYLKKRGIT